MSETVLPLHVFLASEAETQQLGADLALALKPGDCVALDGDLGAGKSTLCRALLRNLADDPELEVPSPTFTLVQNYDLRIPVAHFDLYRLSDSSELDELGFHEALNSGICLVEWPQRAVEALPRDRLSLVFSFEKEGGRTVELSAPPAVLDRVKRSLAIRAFLDANGYSKAERRHLTGDASSRAYEHVYPADGSDRLVLMDAPRKQQGAVLPNGKTYAQTVHLAEDVYPFIAVANALRSHGFSAPGIVRSAGEEGLLLLEDLGTGSVLAADGHPIAERYRASAICLAALHDTPFEREIALGEDRSHSIPDFDRTAMQTEVDLLLDWHLPWQRNGKEATQEERAAYRQIWGGLFDRLTSAETTLVMRDFHSPNIIWREDKTGHERVGLIDFQDAMIGPSAYDVVSLVQDARVTIGRPLMDQLIADYMLARTKADFRRDQFMETWAIMSAQRACKLNGLWVRLKQRDGKDGYMRHMPRTLWHLAVAFEHPVLAPLHAWCTKAGIETVESAP